MSDLFVDAGGWIALANADDQYHAAAAASFAVMRSLGLTDAFAFDQHFSTAGFVRLPSV